MKERISSVPGEPEQSDKSPLLVDIATIDAMDAESLRKLLKLVVQAGWGYGKLTGKDLLAAAIKSKDEAYEALKLAALTLAVNASDWREFNALATFWAERTHGKPSQAIDVTGKIGIVEIVLEAAKLRKMPVIENAEN